jgi:DNA-binding PadR family transcriptional regulator
MDRHEHHHYYGEHEHGCGGRRHFFAGRHGHGGGRRGGFFGSPFGRGGRGGGGMRTARMLASGDLQLLILLLLSEKPRHGYEIIKAIEEHSSGVYTPSPGMVYPALTYLEETGYAEATTDGTKKLYSITATGTEHLTQNRAVVDEVWNHLALFGRKMASMQRNYSEDEDVADRFGDTAGGASRSEWQQLRGEFQGLREELKAAIYEKLSASLEEKRRVLQILRRTIDEIRGK